GAEVPVDVRDVPVRVVALIQFVEDGAAGQEALEPPARTPLGQRHVPLHLLAPQLLQGDLEDASGTVLAERPPERRPDPRECGACRVLRQLVLLRSGRRPAVAVRIVRTGSGSPGTSVRSSTVTTAAPVRRTVSCSRSSR